MKGEFEIEVQGVKRGFKFGTYAFALAGQESGCETTELFDRIGLGEIKKTPDLFCLLNLFYGAAVHYAKSNHLQVDFNSADVSDWLDEIGLSEATRIMASAFKLYDPKNSASPGRQGVQKKNGK